MLLERVAQRSYRAVNRKDLDSLMLAWAPDAVFEFPGRSSISGRFVGKPAIEAWWRRWFDRMRSVHFTVDRVALRNPIALTFANTMFVEWQADVVTYDGIRAHAAGVSVMRFRRGKIVHARDYFFDPTIEEAVWGPAQDANADRGVHPR